MRNKMKRNWMICLMFVTVLSMSYAPAYTLYSDMAGSGGPKVLGYSYTDVSSQDWHYHAHAIYQRLIDPAGNEVSSWGGPTYAQISKSYTIEGNYTVLSRHELWCTVGGVMITPYSSDGVYFSLRTIYFKDPQVGPLGIGCYYGNLACNPGTIPTCSGGIGIGVWLPPCPPYEVTDFLVAHFSGFNICTVAISYPAGGPGDCN